MPAKQVARVTTVFLYPPSETFANNPDGWWSWPGKEYDAEGHQLKYSEEIRKIRVKAPLGAGDIVVDNFLGLGVKLVATRGTL